MQGEPVTRAPAAAGAALGDGTRRRPSAFNTPLDRFAVRVRPSLPMAEQSCRSLLSRPDVSRSVLLVLAVVRARPRLASREAWAVITHPHATAASGGWRARRPGSQMEAVETCGGELRAVWSGAVQQLVVCD